MPDLNRCFRRPAPRQSRARLSLEALEDRTVPATVTYTTATHSLQFVADAGKSDSVFVSAPAPNQVLIQVTGGDTLTLDGDAVGNPDFVLSPDGASLTINTEPVAHAPLSAFDLQLGDMDDTLVLGLADAAHNVGSITVDGGDGHDTVFLNSMTLPGDLSVTADDIAVQENVAVTGTGTISLTAAKSISLEPGSGLSSADGDITLKANQDDPSLTGNFVGIVLDGATITTANGDVLLQGRGGADASSGFHAGIDLDNGSVVSSTGTGTITLTGVGGLGTSQNFGVVIQGAGTSVTSADGAVSITGVAGNGDDQYNIGVMIDDGATVVSTGSAAITITGSGGPGTDYNYGVGVQGAGTAVSAADGHVLILGTGGAGTGQQNVGVFILDGAHVTSTGPGGITIVGTGGAGTQFDAGVHLDGAATAVTTADGDVIISGTATGAGDSEDGLLIVSATVQSTGDADLTFIGHASSAPGAAGGGVVMFTPEILSPNSGNVDFFGSSTGSAFVAVEWDAMTLSKAGGTVTFHDRVLGQGLTVDPGAYAVSLLAGGDFVSAVTFNNTGGVAFGDDPTDVTNFDAGLTSTAGPTTVHGALQTINAPMHLGPLTLADVLLNVGTSTIFLSGDVTALASTVPGQIFGIINLGGARSFTVEDGPAAHDLTVVGSLVNGGLVKNGAGVLQLFSPGTYAGGTVVNAGTLLVNNAAGSATGPGTVTLNGGTLAGDGAVGPLRVQAGSQSPGDGGPGFLRSGNLTFAPGSQFRADLNYPYSQLGGQYDGVTVKGTVNLNKATLVLTGGAKAPKTGNYIWLIQNDGKDPVHGTFAGLPEGALVKVGKFLGRITYKGGDGNDVIIRAGTAQATGGVSAHRILAAGVPAGWPPIVSIFDAATHKLRFQVLAYPGGYRGGVRTGVGDVNGDGWEDAIAVRSSNVGPNLVKVFSGRTGALIGSFLAPAGLMGQGGMFVAAGDMTGDGKAEIVLGSGRGATPRVLIIDGATLKPWKVLIPHGHNFAGGVVVFAEDVNGDGLADVTY